MSVPPEYAIEPEDPRAPPLEIWDKLSPAERQRIVDALPSELDFGPPEGDPHRIPKQRGLDALDAFFRRAGRRVYLSSELPVYYPGERVIAPDLIAVLDVETHERQRWVVADERRGVDFALEVTVEGSRKKDLQDNVERFARLGIPEYFVFDRKQHRLHGWRLASSSYTAIVPQEGRWRSNVLGLDLAVEGNRFRFYSATALVPEAEELVHRANELAYSLHQKLEQLELDLERERSRAEQEKSRAEQEKSRAEQEKSRADEAEQRLHTLAAELEKLKRERL